MNEKNECDHLKKCYCTKCKKSPGGFQLVAYNTRMNHLNNDLMLDIDIDLGSTTDPDQAIQDDYDMAYSSDLEEEVGREELEEADAGVFEPEENPAEESEGEEESEDPYDGFVDNSAIPDEPLSFCLFLMVAMLCGRYITDEGLEIVMTFLNIALEICGKNFRFPKTVAAFLARCQFSERIHNGVKKYVSCTRCHAVHPYSTPSEIKKLMKRQTCSTKGPFINSTRCDNQLFKEKNKKPVRFFYYNSIVDTLKRFFLRDGFTENIKKWKNRQSVPGLMSDIYDGRIWKTFKLNDQDDKPFFEQSLFNLGLSVNVDWFGLYTNSQYSVGAIYLTIQNLPREIRNLRENVILCCLIPGPTEPATFQMNHYLKLVVDELLLFIPGINIQTLNDGIKSVKAALTLVTCDLPATRKVIGMTSYMSKNACNRCETKFDSIPGQPTKRDFTTGCDESTWIMRTNEKHRRDAQKWLNTRTLFARTEAEQENGTRYSELLRLEYFDATRFVAFDICHNIFMGTAKRMAATIWTNNEQFIEGGAQLLTKADLKLMKEQSECGNFVLPFGYDGQSIPKKINGGKGFSYMKSDEFKTWTLSMSPYLLKLKLGTKFYNNWMNFVEATRYLSSPLISLEEVDIMHGYITAFVKDFVSIYKDPGLMVSNMHFHLHLRDTLLDYGPGPTTWVFNFERYNCDIKGIRTNRKDCVELTYLKRFLNTVHKGDYFKTLPRSILDPRNYAHVKRLFIGDDIHGYKAIDELLEEEYRMALKEFSIIDYFSLRNGHSVSFGFEVLPPTVMKNMKLQSVAQIESCYFFHLLDFYNMMYTCQNFEGCYNSSTQSSHSLDLVNTVVSDKIIKFRTMTIFGDVYKAAGTNLSRVRGSYIRAFYRNDENGGNEDDDMDIYHTISRSGVLRPAQIMFYFRHQVKVLGDDGELETITHTFAYVRWFSYPHLELSSFSQHHMQVWGNGFDNDSVMSILPVSRIYSPITIMKDNIDDTNVILGLPPKVFF